MIRVNCPKCGETVEVDESRGAGRKKFRLVCGTCNSRFSIKAAPAPSAPRSDPEAQEDSTLVSMPPGIEEPAQSTVPDPPRGFVSQDDSSIEPDTRGLEKQLEARRSVWGSDNTASAPTTLSFHEDEDGGLDPVDRPHAAPDRLAGRSSLSSGGGYESVSSGGFQDLADAEIELPGDPDEESVDPRSIDMEISGDDEISFEAEAEAEAVDVSDQHEPVPEPEPEPEPEPDPDPDPDPEATVDDPPADAGAMGMSMEYESPITQAPRVAAEPPKAAAPPGPPPKADSGRSRSKVLEDVVVTNLASVAGYQIEPIGMVTHHFCRQGGGGGDEARKRVRAFGIRYRRGLEALAEQAQKLGANAVLGVEIIVQPTDGTDDPVVWVLVQGTAAHLTRA